MKKTLLNLAVLAMFSNHVLAASYYWDSDADPLLNDTSGTGLGAGGAFGTWDNLTTSNWWDGTSVTDSQWDDTASSGAIFNGTAGTVTIPATESRTAGSLDFSTSGYVIAGGDATSKLILNGPATITVASPSTTTAAVTAILDGTSGYSVTGGGTFQLTGAGANTITGPVSVSGTTLNPTTLEVASSTRLGGTGDITLNGGVYRNTSLPAGDILLDTARNIIIGANGGTLDNPGTLNTNGILIYSGTILGTGNTLTKTGTGEIRMNGSTDFGFAKLELKGGLYTLGQIQLNGRDGQLGAVPTSFLQDQITLDGGGIRFNAAASPTLTLHANRGITIVNEGTLLPTTSVNIPGKITSTGTGNLIIGVAAATGGGVILSNPGNDWAGTTTITAGTLRSAVSEVIPNGTAVTMGATTANFIDVNGKTETIASLAGGLSNLASSLGVVNLNGGTLILNQAVANNSSFAGDIVGAVGTVIKDGDGELTITNNWGTGTSPTTNTDRHNVIINNGSIKFGTGAAGFNELGTLTVNSPGQLDMNSIGDSIGQLAGNGNVINNSNTTGGGLQFTGQSNATYSGVISGTYRLTMNKAFQSTQTLTGDNTYGGGTFFTTTTNGTLLVNNAGPASGLGGGAVTLSGGTLGGTGVVTGTVTINSAAAAAGRLKAGAGGSNEDLTVGKVITAGTLSPQIEGVAGTPGPPLGFGSSDYIRITDGTTPLTLVSGTLLTVSATTAAANGKYTIIDTGVALPLAEFNKFVFNNATGYDAAISQDDGDTNVIVEITGTTLHNRAWNSNAVSGTGLDWSASAPAANWSGTGGQINGPGTTATFGSVITANRIVTIRDSNKTVGTLEFNNSFKYTIAAAALNRLIMNTYSGDAAINVISGSHDISAPITISAQTNIDVASGLTLAQTTTTVGVFINNAGITKTGLGTFSINTDLAGDGPVTINGGTLKFATGSAGFSNGSLVTIGTSGTLDINGVINDTWGDLAGDGAIINSNGATGLTFVGGLTTTYSGSIAGTSRINITKSGGSLNLSRLAGNSFNGANVNSGTLYVNNTSNSATGIGAVNVGITTTGAGTLGGNGIITGPITVNSGGTIAPGNSVGTLTAGFVTLNSGAIVNIELGGGLADKIMMPTGTLTLGAGTETINLTNLGGMTAGTYQLIDYNSFSGSFASLVLGTQPAGFTYQLIDNTTDTRVDLLVIAPGENGDYNDNGTVDAADYVLWAMGGDLQHDPTAGNQPADYDYWRARFNNPNPGSTAALLGNSAAVPEPATLALLMLSLAMLNAGVRRRQR